MKPTKHAQKRAKERFGITLDVPAHTSLVRLIEDGKVFFCYNPGPNKRLSKQVLLFEGRLINVLFDHQFRNVVTMCPVSPRDIAQLSEVLTKGNK